MSRRVRIRHETSSSTLVSRAHHRTPATYDANTLDTHTYHCYDQIDAHPYQIHRVHMKMHRLA